ncbi:hypothetical protein CTAYLR_006364 [Chrysophaeum taylorii]|uniref:Thioredoxin domain-containing protein n=1 Tax=Chrysophaeum taylorii TaxID=2483200 RepID=A0AAD7U6E3_9STRA|nr:hypothetical protein CTAYLR_006364 [Chrysophaeum taylorii]
MFRLAFVLSGAFAAPVVLTSENFKSEVLESGKNAFVKFFAPWCGHCKAAKPAWDSLGAEYLDHPNVLIGDVDCTEEKDVCSEQGVSGYPTIKYWVDGEAKSYNGGRSIDQFKKHVEDNLLPKCDVAAPDGCDDQEVAYIERMKSKGVDAAKTELARLEGMKSSAMKPDKKQWLSKRIHILKQM